MAANQTLQNAKQAQNSLKTVKCSVRNVTAEKAIYKNAAA
jgi:hypothetical protein